MAGPGSGEMKEDVLLFVSQPSNFTHARSAGRNGCRLSKKEGEVVANDEASKRDNFPQRRRAFKKCLLLSVLQPVAAPLRRSPLAAVSDVSSGGGGSQTLRTLPAQQ